MTRRVILKVVANLQSVSIPLLFIILAVRKLGVGVSAGFVVYRLFIALVSDAVSRLSFGIALLLIRVVGASGLSLATAAGGNPERDENGQKSTYDHRLWTHIEDDPLRAKLIDA